MLRRRQPGSVLRSLEEDEYALGWALPLVQRNAERLRAQFPELPIAVVSHGLEQFGLLTSERLGPLSTIHLEARDLVGVGVDVHVCGAHASQYGHAPEGFPDYVDVAASGPALLNDYRSLGFEVIRVEQPEP